MRISGADVLADADVAVAVPLHRKRRRMRGFNQADDIAAHLGLRVARVLRRTRATLSQTDLPAARRHANVRGAFALRWRANVAGLRVVLVDDVCTTGATLEACARVLRDAGAAEVRALTAARVSSRPIE
jgi:ComF family protein